MRIRENPENGGWALSVSKGRMGEVEVPDTYFRMPLLVQEKKPGQRSWQGEVLVDGRTLRSRRSAASLAGTSAFGEAWADEIHQRVEIELVSTCADEEGEAPRGFHVTFGSPDEIADADLAEGEWFRLSEMKRILTQAPV